MRIGQLGRNLLLFTISLAGSLLICEIGLRIFTRFPTNEGSAKIEDANLGYRLNPKLIDVDKWGFRNPPDTSRVVAAVGDSHTYGNNVFSRDAWPKSFENISGVPTYNFGVGSYGVYAYHALIKQHIAGQFNGAIIALFPANDFANKWSNCRIIRNSDFWSQDIKRLSLAMPRCSRRRRQIKDRGVGFFIKYQTATGSAIDHLVIDRIRAARGNSKYYEIPGTQESVNPGGEYRRTQMMEIDRDEIRLIWNDFSKMLTDWSKIAREGNFILGIMIIPSKLRVLVEYAKQKDGGNFPSEIIYAVKKEVELESRIIELARTVGIPVESALGSMIKAKEIGIRKGVPLYKHADSHPNAAGYAGYARTAHDLFRRICDSHKDNPMCASNLAGRSKIDQ